ncbi:MAG: DNA repair protein RadA [Flavobacteriaceae bacterium]|nr:DNA repair protein RadA [Flavobacteriaceae bacterium]
MGIKTSFFCKTCGTQHSKWQGQCNSCKEWNTLVEEIIEKRKEENWDLKSSHTKTNKSIQLQKINVDDESRILTSDNELNRVLGGGIVAGSVILLGGEPGVGKSTLLLQIAINLKLRTLYVSGEESQKQIKLRATRMGLCNDNSYVLNETRIKNVFREISNLNPELVIIDSIQTLQSDVIDNTVGSVSQIKQTTTELIQFAKESNIPVFLVGHITKDGQIAGPKVLEHMVDTVLNFEGDRNHVYRILRAQKNRFGATDEIGIYKMISKGINAVSNPSELLLNQNENGLSGQAVGVTVEGVRPLLLEIQALVSSAVYGTPQRSSTGFNAKRLNMLLAVLEKRAGFNLGIKDVFINFTGGISVNDTALDLAVVASILSSYYEVSINKNICFAAEIGLSGELRPVSKINLRIKEAAKLGFKCILISKFNKIDLNKVKIEIKYIEKIEDIISILFK